MMPQLFATAAPAKPVPVLPLSQEAADFLHAQPEAVQRDLRSQIRTRTQDQESYLRNLMKETLHKESR